MMSRLIKRSRKQKNGKIKNATSLVVGDLTFKSKLELFTYQKLIEAGIGDFKYEQDKFILLEGFEFNSSSIEAYEKTSKEYGKQRFFEEVSQSVRPVTYLPDFTCINENKEGWIVECKGYPNDAFPLKWKWFKEHLMKNGYNVTLYKPNNQQNVLKTIELIKTKYYGKND